MNDFEITLRQEPDETVTLIASGEIDLVTSAYLRQELLLVESTGAKKVVVDLTDVRYLDSSGLRVLISSKKRMQAADRQLWITGAAPPVTEVLTILGLGRALLRHARV